MTMQVRLLIVSGALLLGGAALAVRSSPGEGAPTRPAASHEATPPEGSTTVPLPAAVAAAAEEDCDTPGTIEPAAAPLAKFMEAPCGPGEEAGAQTPGAPGPSREAQP